jgi:hypothetical protein
MDDPRPARLVQAALRCYPARWRRQHGEEAADLAAQLIRDGSPAGSIALNYLTGAARERLTPRPGRQLTALACTLLAMACLLGVSTGLLASAGPARAASAGHTHGRAQCRPGSIGLLPAVTPATSESLLLIRRAGHGRAC